MTDSIQKANSIPDINSITSWTASDYASLTANFVRQMTVLQVTLMKHPELMSGDAIAGLTHEDIPVLTVDFYNISGEWLNKLNDKATKAITPQQMARLTFYNLKTLDAHHLGLLTAQQVAGINDNYQWYGAAWLNSLTPEAFRGIPVNKLNQIKLADFSQLDADHIKAITTANMSALNDGHLHALTAEQVAAIPDLTSLSSAQYGLLNISIQAKGINNWSEDDYAKLTATQISTLTAEQISAIKHIDWCPLAAVSGFTAVQMPFLSEVLSQLTADQVATMTNLSALNSSQFGKLDISKLSLAAIDNLTQPEYEGLTAQQISSLSTEQIHAMKHIGWISDDTAEAFTPEQVRNISTSMAYFTAGWLNNLSIEALRALTSAQTSQISSATLAALDNEHLHALTAEQIGGMDNFGNLSRAQFGLLALSKMPIAVISRWSQAEYEGLTATQVSTLSAAQINAMGHAAWMHNDAASGFTPEQIRNCTQDFYWFSPGWFNSLSKEAFQAIKPEHIKEMYMDALVGLDAERRSQLTAEQISGEYYNFYFFSSVWFNSLSPETMKGITAEHFTHIQASNFKKWDNEHLAALTATQVATIPYLNVLTSDQFGYLDISGLPVSAIEALPKAEYQGLTAKQISSLSAEQIQALQHVSWIPEAAAKGFTAEQMPAFGNDISAFTATFINSLSIPAFQTLTSTQLNQITSDVLASLDNAHLSVMNMSSLNDAYLSALPASLVVMLTDQGCLSSLSSAQFGLLNISSLSATAVGGLTQTECAGMTAVQMTSLNTDQIKAIQHPEWLSAGAVGGLTPDQFQNISISFSQLPVTFINSLSLPVFQSLSVTQLNQMSTATLAGLDNAHLATLPLSSLDNAHLSALTANQVASLTNLSSLSTAQFGLLNISGLSTAAMNALSQTVYAAVTAAQIALLTSDQIKTIQHLEWLSADTIGSLLPEQVQGISFSQLPSIFINNLSIPAVRSLSATQVSQIAATALSGLDSAHQTALTAITAALTDIAGWTQAQYAACTASQAGAFTLGQIKSMLHPEWLSAAAVGGLTPSQVQNLTLSKLPAILINGLSLPAFQILSSSQLAQISATTLAALDNAHLAALTAVQVGGMNNFGSLSSAQFGLLNLSQMTTSVISRWTQAQYQGVTALQISTLSPAQIHAMAHTSWMPDSAASSFTAAQVQNISITMDWFSSGWLNNLSISAFQAMTPTQAAQITATTLSALDNVHFAALTTAQIGVIKLDFSTVSADRVNSLSAMTLQGLSTTQVSQLTAATIAGMSDACLSTLTGTQTAALHDLSQLNGHQFSLLSLPAMSTAQVATWTVEQYATLTPEKFSSLTTAQIGAMTNPAVLPLSVVSVLTVAQVNAINTDFSRLPDAWLNSLNTTARQGLTPYQFSHLSSLTPDEVNKITSLAALSAAQFSQLNLSGMAASQIANWTQSNYAALTAQQISTLSTAQIHAMPHADWMAASAAAGLNADQLAGINLSFSYFSAAWLNNLSIPVFLSMTATQLSQLSSGSLSGVDDTRLRALSAAQIASMSNLGSIASTKFGILDISALSTSQLATFTLRQYQGLTQTQMSTLSGTQLQALAHPEWLSPGLINNLSVAQFSAMTADQFAALTTGAIAALDAAHIAAWPGDVTTLTPEELLAVGPHLTSNQFNALTDSQRSQLATSNSTTQSLINGLSDGGLKSIMQSVASAAGTLFSFSAIESVMKNLSAGMSDALSASQYAGLQSYVQSIGQVCGANSSIYGLVNGMVNGGNNASVSWVNGDGTFTRIGSLKAGSPATQFNQLVTAWFDGGNVPMGSSTDHTDNRPLFAAGGPTINDISQGSINDCTLLGGLLAVVKVAPDFIKSMVVQNSNGTYSVRFFNKGVANWINVDNKVCSYGEAVSTSSWAAIFERASAEFEATYVGGNNSYANLGDYGATKLAQITGDIVSSYSAYKYTEDAWNTSVFATLKAAVLSGEAANMGSGIYTNDTTHFISSHEMAILGFNETTNNFVVGNPWGVGGNGTFEASMDQLWQKGANEIHIANSQGINGAAGQLVTAMASIAPVSSASSVSTTSQSAGVTTTPLVTSHT